MGKVKIDDRGRVTLPKEIREALRVDSGEELEVRVEGDEILLKPEEHPVERVRVPEELGQDAFLDSGEATFGE